MSKKDDKKKVSLTKPVLAKESSTPAPEYNDSKPVVKLDKPKTTTKTPRVIEVISETTNKGTVVSFNSKSASQSDPVMAGSISDRAKAFNSLALKTSWTSRSSIENVARTFLGDITVYKGMSDREIAFEIEGVRVPAEGYYFIR